MHRPCKSRHQLAKPTQTEGILSPLMSAPVVTSVSMCAIDAVCMGIPIFTSKHSAVHQLGLQDLSQIESPKRQISREPILYSLAYNQFTPEEFANGFARKILEQDIN